ncbi:Aminotransferase class V [Sterolibacterium denitrificans]|uniref:Aminotransferase class V n=2 Tax=Sterolibacterium denitrificans TaxID=157592 RepID=A0A7Z7HSL2_9PROT|nr:cysteine desulfurase family protein [Sterolibacterium denitrificans]KYC29256.1 cysteine desulfurase [Sterolibacterium denitrificans]SMB30154.1 Aminotransferase class V [Sterolibacterium denitrificans]
MLAPVYFDHNATTPLDARVLEAMLPFLCEGCGNASSRHDYGRLARAAVDAARQQVAAAVGAHATEVIFTSGGSEANNLFIKGAAACCDQGLLAFSSIEHPCVREPARELQRQGWRLHEIAVDAAGRIDAADYAATLKRQPRLISVMLANNETGVMQDVAALAAQAQTVSGAAWFHSDAVQAFGKVAVDFRTLNAAGVHALTLSAHKLGGPQGAGALIVDKRVELRPLIAGGGQERGLRSGTENVAAIVGFGHACTLVAERIAEMARLEKLRHALEAGLNHLGATIFGAAADMTRLPNTVYFALPDIDGETLVGKLDRAGFAVASGAACSSANPAPSHVLQSMGVDPALARGAVRVSLGLGNTARQVDDFIAVLGDTLYQLRRLTALTG